MERKMYHGSSRFNEQRKRWQDPQVVLAELGLRPGDIFMDIGCGDGYFAIPAASLVGENGTVYGLDVNRAAIESLRQGADEAGLKNLKLRVGRAEEIVLCEACADIVFFGTVLHDFQDPPKVLANARKMLKPGGKLADLDWKKEPSTFGPPESIRLGPETASRMIEAAGFKVTTVEESGSHHYLVLAGLDRDFKI
jgi:ubiquinone/menaquinone biosynthesis C-methylase UbiE